MHMDCLHWVNRDSYLPQGSRGLKVLLNRFTQPHESSQLMGLLPRAAPLSATLTSIPVYMSGSRPATYRVF